MNVPAALGGLDQQFQRAESLLKARGEKETGATDPQPDLCLTRREVREFTGWPNARIHRHVKELVDFEYLLVESGRNGCPYRYRLAWGSRQMAPKSFLPCLGGEDGP